MTTLKKRMTLETLNGTGKILRDGVQIAIVRYRIRIDQEFFVSKTQSGTEEIPGLKEIKAQVSVLEGEQNLFDATNLTLQLSDDRRWNFFVTERNPNSGIYEAVNAGEGIMPKPNDSPK
jgi:hypothetical protein